ncbi:hypothetical protein Q4503_11090 [Colwellia sp. 6_MG-2023]|uniref:hypothetical protein n=1 Tax=Colwellia sp. 6_MG-2023 TaxID=3062676 RepID=UPI0026E48CA1|nr:hypothetical protein [Colwellia sp. 6_MG-2023]MDO6488249.1 hypothetical protein [Colwellia sp. 6_MG-2023]
MGSQERFQQGRTARLRAEVFYALQQVPFKYTCVYKRTEQANQYKRGWNSVTAIDIDVAIKKVKTGQANLLPKTAQALGVNK